MRPFIKRLSIIVGALAALVVLVIMLFDWNWLRVPLESRLSAATGERVRILGPIVGEYAWTPNITIDDIEVSAPDWKPDPKVAHIDRVALTVELKKLLYGRVSIPSLAITKPSLHLERRGGKANWDIANEATGPSSRHNVPVIGDVTVTGGEISFRDPDKHLSLDGTLSVLKGNGGPGGGPFTLQGKGTYQHAPFTLKVTGESLVRMRDKNEPYKVSIGADLGATHIVAVGTIDDPINMTGIAIGLQVNGDNAADLYPYLGILAPATPPYRLSGTLDRGGKDIWMFRDFGGKVGVSDLEGSLTFDLSNPKMAMRGTVSSQKLNLADLGIVAGVPTKPSGNAPVNQVQKRVAANYAASDRVLPDAPLEIDAVRDVDVDVNFKAVKLLAQDLPLDHLDMHIKIKDGVLSLDPVQVGVAGGTLRGTTVIDARGEVVKSDSDLRISDFRLEQFFRPQGGDSPITGLIDGRMRFQGHGDSLRKTLGTADGVASFIVVQGTMSKLDASLLNLDVARALGTLISGDKSKKTELRCVVSDFELKNGTMTPRTFVIDTSNATVTGKGTINLADETIDMNLRGHTKKVTFSLRGPILVKGTFRNPHVGLGTEAYVRAGGSLVLGAFLTPVAAIVTFIDSGHAHDADCNGLAADATQNAASEPPVNKTPPAPKHAAKPPGARNQAAAPAGTIK